MKLYLVRGTVDSVDYGESVRVLEPMEEKPNSYVGLGCRVNKSKIGKLEEGMFRDQFQIYLINESEIPEARERIKAKVFEIKQLQYDRLKKEIENLNNHSLESEIIFREF